MDVASYATESLYCLIPSNSEYEMAAMRGFMFEWVLKRLHQVPSPAIGIHTPASISTLGTIVAYAAVHKTAMEEASLNIFFL